MKNKFSLALAITVSLASASASAWMLDANDVIADFYTSPFGTITDNERLLMNNDGAVGGSNGFEFISFMKFDLSDLPTAPVAEAWLSLDKYCRTGFTCNDGSNSMDVSIQRVTADVEISDAMILNGSLGDEVARVSVSADGIYSWNITDLVNDWVSGIETNYGFALTGRFDSINVDSNGDAIIYNDYFVSSGSYDNSANSSFGPRITPSVVPAPAAVWLMGSGLLGLAGIARRRS